MPARVSFLQTVRYRHQLNWRCLFHNSIVRSADSVPNHYEALELKPSASVKDIKHQFYHLSKVHHPDHNPSDPTASSRFVRISEAYRVLSSADKRAVYDRDLSRTHPSLFPHQQRPAGSHSSAAAYTQNPAGGRTASGLSRRRTQFRGPPPSFYKAGGYGAYASKRAANAPGATGSGTGTSGGAAGSAGTGGVGSSSAGAKSSTGGFGPGQYPHRAFEDDIPHWDREGHFRTQKSVEEGLHKLRQHRRVSREFMPDDASGSSPLFNFLVVAGIISVIAIVPSFAFVSRKKQDE